MFSPHRSDSRRPRRGLIGLVAGLVAGSVALGGGAAWAYWTATAKADGKVNTTKVAITQASFSSLNKTWTNTYTPAASQPSVAGTPQWSATGTFTVMNTGASPGPVTLTVASSGTPATKLGLKIWVVANGTTCTDATTVGTGAGSGSGTWASTTTSASAPLGAGETLTFCARTTAQSNDSGAAANITTLATPAGSSSSNATLTAKLTAAGWTAEDTTGVSTQATAKMFPLTTDFLPTGNQFSWFSIKGGNICLDTASGGTAAGTGVTFYTCTDNDNQAFQFEPVSGSSPQTFRIRPLHVPTLNQYVTATAVALPGLQLQLANSTAFQRWHVQQVSASTYQLVNVATGKCLIPATYKLSDCTSASTEVSLNRYQISASTSGTTLTLTSPVKNVYRSLRVQYLAASLLWLDWSGATDAAGTSTVSLTLTPWLLMTSGSYDIRLMSGSDVLWNGTVNYTGSGGTMTLTSGAG